MSAARRAVAYRPNVVETDEFYVLSWSSLK
jgi:hypothetical protein